MYMGNMLGQKKQVNDEYEQTKDQSAHGDTSPTAKLKWNMLKRKKSISYFAQFKLDTTSEQKKSSRICEICKKKFL